MRYDFLNIVPELNLDVVIVAEDPILAAKVSCYFPPNKYVVFLQAPHMTLPGSSNNIIRIGNILARTNPKKVFLLKTKKIIYEEIKKLYKKEPENLFLINSEDEFNTHYQTTFPFKGKVHCSTKDLAYGLYKAKKEQKQLIIDESANLELEIKEKHIVILDENKGLSPIIAVNYALSINASIQVISPPKDEEIKIIYDDILDSRSADTMQLKTELSRSLISQKIKFTESLQVDVEVEFITFITKGIPYGYFFPDIPTTHLFAHLDLGETIFNSCYFTKTIIKSEAALIVDPGYFNDSETELITDVLKRNNIIVKNLINNDATVFNVDNHIQFMPFDLLYICSHAGLVDGEEITIEFKDKKGHKHIIVINEVVGFGVTDQGEGNDRLIEVKTFMLFKSLDGVDWKDKEGKKRINASATIRDFIKMDRENWTILQKKDVSQVEQCNVLKMKDFNLISMFHLISSNIGLPIVINNACSSFYELSMIYMDAGARAYIGTLIPVNTSQAKKVGELIFQEPLGTKPLPLLLWEAQKAVYENADDRAYVHFGVHFTFINPPDENPLPGYLMRINEVLELWENKIVNSKHEDVVRNSKKAVRFLKQFRSPYIPF